LPSNLADVGPVVHTEPFVWETRLKKYSEDQASPTLRPRFVTWMRTGANPALDDVVFKPVERRNKVPLVAESDTMHYTGVPDLVVLRRGLDEDTFSIWNDTAASMDWKTEERFADRHAVAAQATMQVLGFAAQWNANCSPPVFFSDMATGVRCWIMVDGVLYTFHRAGKDLTLEQGVRLCRYFIANDGRLLDADMPRASRAPGPATGGAGTGGGPFTPGPKRSGGDGDPSAGGGSGSKSYLDVAKGKGGSAASGRRVAADVPSRDSSPGDPSCVSDEDVALFKMGLAGAAALLQRCGADLSGVYDLSE